MILVARLRAGCFYAVVSTQGLTCVFSHLLKEFSRVVRPVFKLQKRMSQIGFTKKTESVYDRFQVMRRAYEDKHGRTYAPDFLTVLMDRWEVEQEGRRLNETLPNEYALGLASDKPQLVNLTALISLAQDDVLRRTTKPVSLHDYAASAEKNDPLYLEPENETQ